MDVTNSMAEYGFYKFYDSISKFKFNLRVDEIYHEIENKKVHDDMQPLTIEHLRKPIIIVVCLNGIALLSTVVEILLVKWLNWRKCKRLIYIFYILSSLIVIRKIDNIFLLQIILIFLGK